MRYSWKLHMTTLQLRFLQTNKRFQKKIKLKKKENKKKNPATIFVGKTSLILYILKSNFIFKDFCAQDLNQAEISPFTKVDKKLIINNHQKFLT